MKRILKWILLFVVFSILSVAVFAVNEWYGKPVLINNFFNRVALKTVFKHPETLSSMHFLEQYGIKAHNAELNDITPEFSRELFDYFSKEHAVLKKYENESLSKNELLSKKIAEYLFELAKQAEPYQFHTYPVNQLSGVQNSFPTFMDAQHQINDVNDAEDYISRLHKLPLKFSQTIEALKHRQENGIVPPKFILQRVVDEISNFTEHSTEQNILYQSLQKKLNNVDSISDKHKQDILLKAKTAITEDVYPAYESLSQYLSALSDKGDDRAGFWKLPDGDKAYQVALKFFTGTDYTPDYIHHVGLNEVARIQQQMMQILSQQGIDTSQGFYTAISTLTSQDRFYYEDSAAGRVQILKDYQKIIDEIDANLGDSFNIKNKAAVQVERIPQFKEKTSPGAYYIPAAVDNSRPGRFSVNLYDVRATPKFGMRTLAYHEAVPGHHFQVSISQELEGVPFFRKLSIFTAYTEGWALYAERLAWELGFLKDPFDNVGRLQDELFRAVRLVVDTGIHAKRWTRQQAIDYMIENTGMAETDITAEVERYIVLPGQACAYKIGMMKILELRAKSQQALGSRFKLSEFHNVILKNGAVPLDILEELVDEYIQTELNRTN
ncbi:DUF885 domain-containing protein [Aliikangiella maris]|uniref:DUF885 domain-containing protein n=2 Tax=Aliikangiella maris TaxID=3162458 RepID=A0ABV3MIR5_9GAMM